jgi:Ca2+/Na+ antiporter
MCGKEKKGIEVQDDFVLDSVRWIKKTIWHSEKHNKLVVCREDYPNYKKSRSRYEFRQRLYIGLGVLFVLLMIFLSPRLTTLLSAAAILILFYLFSLLSYTPKIKLGAANA